MDEHRADLLRRFADEGAQDALAGWCSGKLGLVYAAALRQADHHLLPADFVGGK